jgi:hypothetical protein
MHESAGDGDNVVGVGEASKLARASIEVDYAAGAGVAGKLAQAGLVVIRREQLDAYINAVHEVGTLRRRVGTATEERCQKLEKELEQALTCGDAADNRYENERIITTSLRRQLDEADRKMIELRTMAERAQIAEQERDELRQQLADEEADRGEVVTHLRNVMAAAAFLQDVG